MILVSVRGLSFVFENVFPVKIREKHLIKKIIPGT